MDFFVWKYERHQSAEHSLKDYDADFWLRYVVYTKVSYTDLSIYLHICIYRWNISTHLSTHLASYLPIYLSSHLPIYDLTIYPSSHLPNYLETYPSILSPLLHLKLNYIYLPIYLPNYSSIQPLTYQSLSIVQL